MTRPAPPTVRWLLVLATGVLHYAAARLGLFWATDGALGSFVWPASGVAVAGATLFGWRAAVAVAISGFAATLPTSSPWRAELVVALADGLAALVAGTLLRHGTGRARGFDPTFRRTRDAILFVIGGCVVPAAITSCAVVATLTIGGRGVEAVQAWPFLLSTYAVWSAAVAPLFLSWWADRTPLTGRAVVHLTLSVATALGLTWAMFVSQWLQLQNKVYMFFPLLVWAGLALGVRGASLVLGITVVGLVGWVTSLRELILANGGDAAYTATQIGLLQYVGITGVTAVLVSALASERDRLHELHEAERALGDSEERLRLALDASRLGDWTWNAATDVVSLSARAAEVFGLGGRQFITWAAMRGMLHAADQERAAQAVERALADRTVYDIEYRVRRPDGGETWVSAKGHGQYDTAGTPTGMVGIVQDVTNRRRAEEELRSREERYRFLAELGEATRALTDPAKVMATIAQRLGEHLRVSRCSYADVDDDGDRFTIRHDYTDGCPSAVGEYRLDQFGPDVAAALRAGRTAAIADVDRELGPAGGAERFNTIGLEAVVCCPLVKQGRLSALMIVHQSIPRSWSGEEVRLLEEVAERSWAYIERARAQAEAREREELFRHMADTIPQLAWMAGPDGEIFWYNQRWYDYTGRPAAEMAGWGWQSVHDPLHLTRVLAGYRSAVSSGRAWEDTFPLRRHDGQFRWHLSRALPLRDEQGHVTLWFGTNTDVTDQRRIEAELRAAKEQAETAREQAETASAAKDQFLAVLSHELRTPLTPVLTLAELLEGRMDVPAEVREDATTIRRNVALEARLIDDLLDLTRVSRGKLVLHTTRLDAHEKVRHVLSMVDAEASGKNLTVLVELSAAAHHVEADPARLQQIVWNLLKNAVKFTPEGGRVQVRTSNPANGRLRVEVIDSGVGIEPAVLPRIFKAFEQGDASVTRQFGGLGLGLAISKALVDLHGGSLEAFSEGHDRGATLALELPAAASPSSDEPADRPRGDARARRLRILLVEDHEDTARIMQRLLRRSGHRVSHADTVASAIMLAEAGQFDVVLSDVGLPDGTGYDVMRHLRAHRPIKGIALSGYGMEEDVRRSLEAGFADHLTKPVNLQRLEEALQGLAEGNGV